MHVEDKEEDRNRIWMGSGCNLCSSAVLLVSMVCVDELTDIVIFRVSM